MIGKIGICEIKDARDDVSSAVAQMGKLRATFHAAAMTPERRAEIARKAAEKQRLGSRRR